MKFGAGMCSPQTINRNDFGDPLNFFAVLPAGQSLHSYLSFGMMDRHIIQVPQRLYPNDFVDFSCNALTSLTLVF